MRTSFSLSFPLLPLIPYFTAFAFDGPLLHLLHHHLHFLPRSLLPPHYYLRPLPSSDFGVKDCICSAATVPVRFVHCSPAHPPARLTRARSLQRYCLARALDRSLANSVF